MEYQTGITFLSKKLTLFLCETGDRNKKLPTTQDLNVELLDRRMLQ